ncbi:MAG: EAL domain-containing protein [Pseudomonadota bacterium]
MRDAGKFDLTSLHWRYSIAILMVAVLALAGLLAERVALNATDDFGNRINMAGKQRMLSQRVEKLVNAARLAPDADSFRIARENLVLARNKMFTSHEQLVADREDPDAVWPTPLEDAYFSNPLNANSRVLAFIGEVDRFLELDFDAASSVDVVFSTSPDETMAALDAVVTLYEQEELRELARHRKVGDVVFLINLIALAAMGLFVFRPIVTRFRVEHQNLQTTYRKLLDEMAERHQLDRQRAAAEARFRNAFENAPIGMGLMKPDGKLFDANPALCDMFNDPMDDGSFDFSRTFTDADRDRFNELVSLVLNSGDKQSRKLRCHDSDGNEMFAVVNLSPVAEGNRGIKYLVLQVEDFTESHSLNTKLEYQASYDDLTGLMNRRAFNREVEEAWSASSPGLQDSFLLMMDLDQFKIINDTSGHAAGDQLLRRVSEVIKDCVRGDDVVCRLGGDEFGVILQHCPAEVAQRIAETIRANISALRFSWGNETYRVGASIGGVPIDPDLGDVSEIQQLADAACYAAKEAGRNTVEMVTEGRDDARKHRRQIRWVQRIRDAMQHNRFAIYGQVIRPVNAAPDAPERIEILLRLRDVDEKRMIPPGAFLPAAERYGLNLELDEWVVSRLIDMIYVHQALDAEDVRYWVNLSGNSVGDERFATTLLDLVRNAPLRPGTLNFEITETAVIRNIASAGRLMTELQAMGCQIALDDFGSGLSSFGYLKHLPINYLKIDGMFIKDIEKDSTNRIFVKSIIDIAHSMGIETVAEFVENDNIASIVSDLGVDYLQGYALGRPYVLAPRFPETAANSEQPLARVGS